jgi:hypothetical protein
MAKLFDELRERLLHAGVAPRNVRRYCTELREHLADLTAEEARAGGSGAEIEARALVRLGGVDELATAMIAQRGLQSWTARAPWAAFSLGPLCLLAMFYFVALFVLWSGWKMFLPGAETPFGHRIGGFAGWYFQCGRALYYAAPILAGWGMAWFAVRQRAKMFWPLAGMLLAAWAGSMAGVEAGLAVAGGIGHIQMNFGIGPLPQQMGYTLGLFLVAAAPYFAWRLRRT